MRNFFLGDTLLTSCGNRTGRGRGGIAYFCPYCGRIWGRVELGWLDWMAATVPCAGPECRENSLTYRNGMCPGSFLKPLAWWDGANGRTLESQLNLANSTLLRYETERHLEWTQL